MTRQPTVGARPGAGARPTVGSVLVWALLGAGVLTQIGYPLTGGTPRARLVIVTVLLGYAASVVHAATTRGPRAAAVLVAVTTGGGLAVELVGVATGWPFGRYAYTGTLGPQLGGVPLVIALAWTWMAWPAWLVAGRLVSPARVPVAGRLVSPARVPVAGRLVSPARIPVAGVGLAAWDLFLDPQMVAEGYWRWADPHPALPGVAGIPVSNFLGWLAVGTVLMSVLAVLAGNEREPAPGLRADAPMLALYLWTYLASVLALAVFLGLPAAAGWGALGMGVVAVPLAVHLVRLARPGVPLAEPPRRAG